MCLFAEKTHKKRIGNRQNFGTQDKLVSVLV